MSDQSTAGLSATIANSPCIDILIGAAGRHNWLCRRLAPDSLLSTPIFARA
jgi:hypothetical protein